MKSNAVSPPLPASADTPKNSEHGDSKPRLITSQDLFGDTQEIEIDHNGTSYRLRKTSLGKLILTK